MFPYDFRQALINSLLGIVICLSLVVIIGFVGQISVVQLALAGVAGFTMSHLTTDVGGIWAKFPISLLIGASVATIVGLVVAVSALRVRGVSLAVVTLSAAVALEQFGFLNARWGGGDQGSPVAQPAIGGLDLSPGGAVPRRGRQDPEPDVRLPRPRRDRSCSACSSRTRGARASASGCSPFARTSARRPQPESTSATSKLAGFAIAAFIAGMAGALYAYNFGSVSYSRFGAVTALGLIAFAYFGGITMVSGAVIAGVGATEGLFPHFFDRFLGLSGNWTLLVGGFVLIVTLISDPGGHRRNDVRKKQQQKKDGGQPERRRAGPGPGLARLGRPRRRPERRGEAVTAVARRPRDLGLLRRGARRRSMSISTSRPASWSA